MQINKNNFQKIEKDWDIIYKRRNAFLNELRTKKHEEKKYIEVNPNELIQYLKKNKNQIFIDIMYQLNQIYNLEDLVKLNFDNDISIKFILYKNINSYKDVIGTNLFPEFPYNANTNGITINLNINRMGFRYAKKNNETMITKIKKKDISKNYQRINIWGKTEDVFKNKDNQSNVHKALMQYRYKHIKKQELRIIEEFCYDIDELDFHILDTKKNSIAIETNIDAFQVKVLEINNEKLKSKKFLK